MEIITLFDDGSYAVGRDYSSKTGAIGCYKITKEELEKIKSGYGMAVNQGNLEITSNVSSDETERVAVSIDKTALEVEKYPAHVREQIIIDAILTADNTELQEMKDFLDNMQTEFDTNWKDADFTQYIV